MTYDSRPDTEAHIKRVQELLEQCRSELAIRAARHDESKLQEPEKSVFDVVTPKLKTLVYGSPEYAESLKEMGVALDHHYAYNSHHPQHYKDGINGMSLLDLVEMFCDWKAASERHADGSFAKSLEINHTRFSINEQLMWVFENTGKELGW